MSRPLDVLLIETEIDVGGHAAAVTVAADDGFSDLRADILRRYAPTFAAEHLDPNDFALSLDLDGPRLEVTISGPPLSTAMQQALGVRVLDAVRAAGRVFGRVNVRYRSAA